MRVFLEHKTQLTELINWFNEQALSLWFGDWSVLDLQT